MPLPREDVEATTPKFLRDKYAIVGVGETSYTRGSDKSTRALASIAVRNAMVDAGIKPSEIDGMLSYQFNDSVSRHSSRATSVSVSISIWTCSVADRRPRR